MKRTIRRQMRYPHPPERVWRALTTREALATWLMPNDFVAEVGHRFNFKTDPAPGFDGIVHCEVLELDEPRRMVWSWKGGPVDTQVTFELQPTADGTELRFEQAGFEGPSAVMVSFILQAGFSKLYGELLPRVLERYARGEPVDGTPLSTDHEKGIGHRFETAFARVAARFARK